MGATHPTVFHLSFLDYAFLFYTWSEDVWVVLGLLFLSTFSTVLTKFFPSPISIGIHTLWAQLRLEFLVIILKLCIFVLQSLKVCVLFWGYPPIIQI